MNSRMAKRAFISFVSVAFFIGVAVVSPVLHAQAAAQRLLGTVTAISGSTLTVKTDAGAIQQVQVPATAGIEAHCSGTEAI